MIPKLSSLSSDHYTDDIIPSQSEPGNPKTQDTSVVLLNQVIYKQQNAEWKY